MKKISVGVLTALASACLANAQFRPIDWSSWGGNAQRSGWEKTDTRLTKENAKNIQLLWKRKLDNGQTGAHALQPPIDLGNLISYKGFKELAIVAGRSGKIWAIDADLNQMFWVRQLAKTSASDPSGACPGGLTSTPALMPPRSIFGGGGAKGKRPVYHRPPPGAIRQVPIYAVSPDGMLHRLNPSTGEDLYPPVHFLPADAKASNLAAIGDTIYTTTSQGCGGAPNAVWAIDMSGDDPKTVTGKITSFATNDGEPVGLAGVAVARDGTVYMQTSDGKVNALAAKTLALKGSFTIPGGAATVTPAIVDDNGRNLIVAAGKDGLLYLLDAQSLSAVSNTEPLSSAVSGAFATWTDPDSGTSWIFAPAGKEIAAFKVEDQNGKPALTRAWASPQMSAPQPPVVASGMVFALDAGPESHATLYALDAATGKQLYSTGDQVTTPGDVNGITVVNGRVYFETTDNTLWQFGIFMEH